MSASLVPRAWLGIAVALVAGASQAATDGALAQQCFESVAKLYRDSWPDGVTDDGTSKVRFESHYNSQLGECLYLETVSGLTRSPALDRILPRTRQRLRDVDENRTLGKFDRWDDMAPITCWVQGQECGSAGEWQQLIDPYLQN
ncbi:MAG TPA: hypothetical protein VEI05_03250 [Burkholderiaceae bacterium]|nr:hypothetical protein [Burkholderiaceae bacterium]